MLTFILVISLTIGISGFCSLLEAMVLSSTTAEIEALKKVAPREGNMMQAFKTQIEETSSAILSLNTIANTLGAVLVGGLATKIFGEDTLLYFSLGTSMGILFFAEIIPKNIGVIYRGGLIRYFVYPLYIVRLIMLPLSWVCKHAVQLIAPSENNLETSDEEILLLAEKGAKEGTMTSTERDLIANALSLENVTIREIMTPRTVVTALEQSLTLGDLLKVEPTLPFARMPVYKDKIDDIVGVIRRRDILKAQTQGKDRVRVQTLMQKVLFLPETGSVFIALQEFLKAHQQLAIIVDEFGSFAGVLTLEDVMESILGKEIFEKDDVAVDMRELARHKKKLEEKSDRNS